MKLQNDDQQTPSETRDLVVFDILRDSRYAECLQELPKGEFLFWENGRPLCLTCSDLDHLVYLPRGNSALTRRARKHSALSAVGVRFSRAPLFTPTPKAANCVAEFFVAQSTRRAASQIRECIHNADIDANLGNARR
jgi:hypothetical protein